MVADSRQTQAISGVSPVQGWERYREDAREAVLARIIATPDSRAAGSGRTASPNQPAGLVRALVLQANSETEALVDIGGKPYVVNTRQALNPGDTVVLRLLDDRNFLQAEASRAAGAPRAATGDASAPVDGGAPALLPGGASPADGLRAVKGVAPTPLPSLAELNTDTGDARIQLSGSARLLLALAGEAPGSQRTVPLTALHLPAHGDTGAAAQRIQQAVEQSGLFYEAHLQEWREGRRSLDTLRAEPQAALSPGPLRQDDTPSAKAAPTGADHTPDTPEQSAAKGLAAALDAIPDDVRPLVQDQIALLQSGRLAMQGAWGDRPFTLEVEPDGSRAYDADLPMAWRVRLVVDTPHLGKLQLDISLAGTSAQVNVRPDTKSLRGQRLRDLQAHLQAGGFELQEALQARGLAMSDLDVTVSSRPVVRP